MLATSFSHDQRSKKAKTMKGTSGRPVLLGTEISRVPTTEISYAKHYSRSHDAVIRVYDEAGNAIETHERGNVTPRKYLLPANAADS